jgi:hypothetical protein
MRKQINKTPRTDNVNERYYERNNHPSFFQFDTHHFTDEAGRKYMIADRNTDAFQNKRLRYSDRGKECVVNNYGEITLYVKLPRKLDWFSEMDSNRTFTIKTKSGDILPIVLRTFLKTDSKRRAGTITVSGLSPSFCNMLLSSTTK